jgi:hypothetical protein
MLPPPAEDIMDNVTEVSDVDGEMWRPNPRSFPTMKTGFQTFEWKLQKRIIREQPYLEVIRNHALSLFADYEQSVVSDENVASLYVYDDIVISSTAGCLMNRSHQCSCPAAQ